MRSGHNDVRRGIELGLFSNCLFETVARDITCHNLQAGCDGRDRSMPETILFKLADGGVKEEYDAKRKVRYFYV